MLRCPYSTHFLGIYLCSGDLVMKHVCCVLVVLLCSVLAFSGQGIGDDDIDADYYFSRGQY